MIPPKRVSMQLGHTKGNGDGINEADRAYSLEAVGNANQAVVDVFRLDPESSNSMKSLNPNSGCHRENVCHTLDCTEPNPSKNQGGMAIVETTESDKKQRCFNKSTRPHGKDEAPTWREADVAPTLNVFDQGESRVTSMVVEDETFAFQLCGDRKNPSVSVGRKAFTLAANPMSDRGQAVGCWAWKDRQRMSSPKNDIADPVTATDYKEPDLVGYEEKDPMSPEKETVGLSDHSTPTALIEAMPPLRACDWKCPSVCGYEGKE